MPLLLALLLGCPGEPPEPFLAIGTGERAFVPLADGDEAEVVYGPQGGYHVVASLQVAGVDPGDPDDLGDPDNPTIRLVARHEGEALAAFVYEQGLREARERGVYEMLGRLLILDIATDDEIVGDALLIEASVEDVHGVRLEAELELLAVAAPTNP